MTLINKTKFHIDNDFLVCMLYKYSYYLYLLPAAYYTDWTELNVLLYAGTRVNWAAVVCMVAFDNLK